MRYLTPIECKAAINANKIIEQLVGRFNVNNFMLIRYLNMFKSQEAKYAVSLHEVFDDRDEGIENIYDFSHFDPDSSEGVIQYFNTFEDALNYSKSLGANENKFLMDGYLQEEFLKQNL